jgi:hypothetical protein
VYSYFLYSLQIEQSPDSSLAIIITPIMKNKSIQSLCRTAGLTLVGSLTLAAAATVSQNEKAAAIDLNFNSIDTTRTTVTNSDPYGIGTSSVTSNILYYRNVAAGVDARITAKAFNTATTAEPNPSYSFVEHIPNYTSAGNSKGDTGFIYQVDSGYGKGGMDYTFDFFTTANNVHDYANNIAPADLRFLIYDVDGQTLGDTYTGGTVARTQTEALRIADNSGLIGYQVGTTNQALIPSRGTDGSYLFSGRDHNVAETNSSGSTVLYFSGVNKVNFRFEANTINEPGSTSAADPVFSAIDGDLSIINKTGTAFTDRVLPGFGNFVAASPYDSGSTAVPEPFTIIGTLIGGTAAVRMRKKLKASKGA